ncbi:glycosyltransferase family 4 protein [Comamonas thiooxydans]|uniref:glycosyltransferase family 4 protein n=1 Tax=Comamonas thiooxydans TaxID=363952 RepID=UPI0006A8BC7F|nr:glycosyltransferase family 1 protein [Comamonas thiooxydans]CUA91543.1 Glycosyltransferase involved in cell wall bisynthesis [Comamonas thiooxydans]
MKIFLDGIVYSIQNFGGISVYFNELIRTLENEICNFQITTYNDKKQNPFPSNSEVTENSRFLERYRNCKINSDEFDIFHSTYYRNPENRKIKNIVTVHDFVYEHYNNGLRKFVHSYQKFSSIRNADRIICISEATKKDLLHFLPHIDESLIDVIYNGVSNTYRPENISHSEDRPFLLFIGARSGYKNFHVAAKALEHLKDFKLVCVGGGKLSESDLSGLPSSIQGRIEHAGFLSEEAINHLYNQAFCLVYPSSYEGFGIPVAEAMQAGCPVVTSKCEAVIEVGQESLTVVEKLDAFEFAKNIERLFEKEYRQKKIESGLVLSKKYDWRKTHQHTLDVYRKALG